MKFNEYECQECGKTFKATVPSEKGPCCTDFSKEGEVRGSE